MRLASTRLRQTRRGRAAGEATFGRPKRVPAGAVTYFCIAGIEKQGFGRLNRLTRSCGAAKIRL